MTSGHGIKKLSMAVPENPKLAKDYMGIRLSYTETK